MLADTAEPDELTPDTPRAPWRMKDLIPAGIYIDKGCLGASGLASRAQKRRRKKRGGKV